MKTKDAQASFENLKKAIRSKELPAMILLYGEERYLRKQYFDIILKQYDAKKGDMNSDFYEGKGINIGALIDQAETLPMFAERRVTVLEDTGLFKAGGEQLAEYLENPCETTVFVFYESEVDERSKLYKTVKAKGIAAQIDEQSREVLRGIIGSFLKKEGKKATLETADLILDKTGNNMGMLRCELEKLVTYKIDSDIITNEDVEAVCSRNVEDRIFDLIDAIADRNAKKAMDLYYDLIALRESPIKLLALMEKQYNQLLQIRLLRDEGGQPAEIADKCGINRYFIGKYMTRASRYSAKALREIFESAVQTDEDIKMGRISERLGVETLILTLLGQNPG